MKHNSMNQTIVITPQVMPATCRHQELHASLRVKYLWWYSRNSRYAPLAQHLRCMLSPSSVEWRRGPPSSLSPSSGSYQPCCNWWQGDASGTGRWGGDASGTCCPCRKGIDVDWIVLQPVAVVVIAWVADKVFVGGYVVASSLTTCLGDRALRSCRSSSYTARCPT